MRQCQRSLLSGEGACGMKQVLALGHAQKYPGTVVAVTHDRYFLENVAGWILELNRGHAHPYSVNYAMRFA
jgi:ATPase subunit of ABC transporter with duplicated ATPase domains